MRRSGSRSGLLDASDVPCAPRQSGRPKSGCRFSPRRSRATSIWQRPETTRFVRRSVCTLWHEEQWSGVWIKLAGQIEFNPITNGWEVSFENLPQLPIDQDLRLHFNGGPRALLSTPPTCGTATSTADLEPWSANAAATAFSSFQIESGAQGTPVQAPHRFSPAFVTNAAAGSEPDTVSSLAMLVSHPEHDEEQELGTIAIEAPPALAQMFADGRSTCGEPRGSEGLCGAANEVGQVGATVGLGAHPVTLNGPIYLTGPYDGAAQSLAIVLPLDPAPFDFGTEVVQMAIGVNPSTGALTIASGQLPRIDDGVPLHIDELLLRFDRGTFKTNPACEPLAVTGTFWAPKAARRGSRAVRWKPPRLHVPPRAGLDWNPTPSDTRHGKGVAGECSTHDQRWWGGDGRLAGKGAVASAAS